MIGVGMHTTIQTLHKKGFNKSQISRKLERDRKTDRKILLSIKKYGNIIKKTDLLY